MVSNEEREFNKNLGDMIRVIRTRFGLSQKDIANKIGVTFQQMQKYEVGDNAISAYKLHQISQILETSFVSRIMHGFPEFKYKMLPVDKIKSITKGLERELLG